MNKEIKILIVDDHPAMRQGIALLVGNEPDFRVCGEAANREDTLAALAAEMPDMVILDITLNEGDRAGLELISEIIAQAGPVPILIYSMHDEMVYAVKALQAGARGYLMKQEPVRRIVAALRHILTSGIYVSDAVTSRVLRNQLGVAPDPHLPGTSLNSLADLSVREREVFDLMAKGLPPRVIAQELHISAKTVETHRRNIRIKLEIPSASDMIRFAVDWHRRP